MSVTRTVLLLLSLTAVLVQGEQAELKSKTTKPKVVAKKPAPKPKVAPKSAPKKAVPVPTGFPWCACNIRKLEASPWRLRFTGYEPLMNKTAACFALEVDPECPPSPCAHMSVDKIELQLKGTTRYTPYAWVHREVAACGWGDAPDGANVLKVMNLGLTAQDVEDAGGMIPVCFSMGKYKSVSSMSGLGRDTVRFAVFGPEFTGCCPTGITAPGPKPSPPNPPVRAPKKPSFSPPQYPDYPDAPRFRPKAPRPPKRVVIKTGKPPVPAIPVPPSQPPPPFTPESPEVPCHPDPVASPAMPCHPDVPASPSPPTPLQPEQPCDLSPPPLTPVADPGFPYCNCNRDPDATPWRILLANNSVTATGSKVVLTVRVARGQKSKERLAKLEFKIDPAHRQVIQNAKLNDKIVTPIWENDRDVVKITNLDLAPGSSHTLSFDVTGCTLAHMCGTEDHCKYALFNSVNADGLCPVNILQL